MNIDKLGLQAKASLSGVFGVIIRPRYIFIAILGAFLSSSLILWSLNLELVRYILFTAPISFISKIQFFLGVYRDIFTTFESIQTMGILTFSFLFGINLTLIVFVIKHQGFNNIPKKSGFGGIILAVISGGCIACGTSLLAPLLATFGAITSTFLRDLSLYLNWIGSLLMLYSIFKLGLLSGYLIEKQKLDLS